MGQVTQSCRALFYEYKLSGPYPPYPPLRSELLSNLSLSCSQQSDSFSSSMAFCSSEKKPCFPVIFLEKKGGGAKNSLLLFFLIDVNTFWSFFFWRNSACSMPFHCQFVCMNWYPREPLVSHSSWYFTFHAVSFPKFLKFRSFYAIGPISVWGISHCRSPYCYQTFQNNFYSFSETKYFGTFNFWFKYFGGAYWPKWSCTSIKYPFIWLFEAFFSSPKWTNKDHKVQTVNYFTNQVLSINLQTANSVEIFRRF